MRSIYVQKLTLCAIVVYLWASNVWQWLHSVLVVGKDFVSLKLKVSTLGTPYNLDIYVHSIVGLEIDIKDPQAIY